MSGEIQITPEGEEWVLEQFRKHNIPAEVLLNELGKRIKEILEDYRRAPLGAIMQARRGEELEPVSEAVERLLKEIGLEQNKSF